MAARINMTIRSHPFTDWWLHSFVDHPSDTVGDLDTAVRPGAQPVGIFLISRVLAAESYIIKKKILN